MLIIYHSALGRDINDTNGGPIAACEAVGVSRLFIIATLLIKKT